MEKVSENVAINDYERFIDSTGLIIPEEEEKKTRKEIIQKIKRGIYLVDENSNISVKLGEELETTEGSISEIKIQNRVKTKVLKDNMSGVDVSNLIELLAANMAARTGLNSGYFGNIDIVDFNNIRSIVSLFL